MKHEHLPRPLPRKLVISRWLMFVSTIGLFAFGFWQWQTFQSQRGLVAAALVVVVMLILKLVENKSLSRTQQILHKLKTARPAQTLKKNRGDFDNTSVVSILKGDVVKVPADTIIPLDGTIVSGTTSIDDEPLTGFENPRPKGVGDEVIGGTYNRDSDICVEVSRNPDEHVLDVMLKVALEKFGTTTPFYRSAQQIALSLTFLGILCALVASYLSFTVFALGLSTALYHGLMVMLSFSVFSLVPSTLMTANVLLKNLFEQGIFIRDSSAIRRLAQIDLLFFEKTRTLTKGRFEYSQTFIEQGTNLGNFLSAVFSVEAHSPHPIALAMETHPWYHEIGRHPVRDFKEHPGLGVSGTIQTRTHGDLFVAIGNVRLLKRLQLFISRDLKSKIDDLETMGETVIACGYERSVRGLMSFADVIRPHVRKVLKKIQKMGIEIAILTGESQEDIEYLTNTLKIQKIYDRCTPEEKASKIAREKNAGHMIGFLGTPDQNLKLEKIDVRLSVDTGPDIATQTSDICMMSDDIRQVAWLIKQSRRFARGNIYRLILAGAVMATQASLAVMGAISIEVIIAVNLLMNLFFIRVAGMSDHFSKEGRPEPTGS